VSTQRILERAYQLGGLYGPDDDTYELRAILASQAMAASDIGIPGAGYRVPWAHTQACLRYRQRSSRRRRGT
jgi:hypothetical protein